MFPESQDAALMRAMLEKQRQGRTPLQSGMGGGMGGGMAPAMSSPDYAAANRTFDTENARIKQQRAMAMQLMQQAGESPSLIKAGNVSVAGANPMSALAQGLRGYMGGKSVADARRSEEDVIAQTAERDAAAGNVMAAEVERERQAALQEQANLEAERDRGILEFEATHGLAKAAANAKSQGTWDTETFHGTDGGVITTMVNNKTGKRHLGGVDGPIIPYNSVEGLTPYKAPTVTGSTPLTPSEKREQDAEIASLDPVVGKEVPSPILVTSILTDDAFATGTGLNVDRFTGEYLPGLIDGSKETQAYQRKISQFKNEGLLPAIREAKLTPVSDKDLKVVEQPLLSLESDPYTVTDYMVSQYRPFFNRTFDYNIENGLNGRTQEDKAQYMNELDRALVVAAQKSGYPLERLAAQGVNASIIAEAQAAQGGGTGTAATDDIEAMKARLAELEGSNQ